MIFKFLILVTFAVLLCGVNSVFAETYSIDINRGTSTPGCERNSSCFEVSNALVEVGDTLTWYNADSAAHTITGGSPSKGPDGRFDSGLISSGGSFPLTFTYADRFPYFCAVHPWMSDVVIVKEKSKASTRLTLDVYPNMVREGGTVTISGKLTSNGQGIRDGTIYIRDFDPVDISHDPIRTVVTDSNGNFKLTWAARDLDSGDRQFSALFLDVMGGMGTVSAANSFFNLLESTTVEVFAQYNGNSYYQGSKSCSNSCRSDVITLTGTSTESKIMTMVLDSVVPGSSEALQFASMLNSNELSQSDYNLVESKLRSAIMSELGIDASTLSMADMISILENPNKYQKSSNHQSNSKSSSSSYSSNSYSKSIIDKLNQELDRYQTKKKNVQSNYNNAISYVNSLEQKHNSHLGTTKMDLRNISNDIENKYLFEQAGLLVERGYSDQAYRDILKENYRLDELNQDISSIKNKLKNNFSDSDYDGIINSIDKCDHQKETFNGYKDSDGCPDTKPIDWAQKALKSQNVLNSKIISLKSGINQAEKSLSGVWYDSAAQWNIDQAWTELWWAKKYLGDAEWTQKEGEKLVGQNYYQNAFYKYENSIDSAEKINVHLNNISFYLDKAQKVHYGK